MTTQDDINNLTEQINAEQQSAALLENEISKEQQNSAQRISKLQEKARRHHDAAAHMQQNLEAKQKQHAQELAEAAVAQQHADDKAKLATKIATHNILF